MIHRKKRASDEEQDQRTAREADPERAQSIGREAPPGAPGKFTEDPVLEQPPQEGARTRRRRDAVSSSPRS